MILHTFDIPDDVAEQAAWLERGLAGPHLAELIAELQAIQGTNQTGTDPTGRTLDVLLGESAADVFESGLTILSEQQLGHLFRSPQLLLELQEQVLIEGGAYWQVLIDQAMVGHIPPLPQVPNVDKPEKVSVESAPAKSRKLGLLGTLLVMAASVAIGVYVGHDILSPPPVQTASAWGWQADDALPQQLTREEYLLKLATGADAWFKKRPDNAMDVATRIGQFRSGCSRLLLSSHEPLTEEDRTWLLTKCRLWAGKIDEHLAALESGQDVLVVRTAMDTTVQKLVDALKKHATENAA